ncbi:MAG: flagellar protein FlgN [Deltaproteobacteria bacterium]|nr:flagellar protein FlgN [Deltaproteobacteria bacterium]
MTREPQRAILAELLGVERECCTRLERIVADERRAVAERDLPALLEALQARETLQAQWRRATEERRSRFAAPGVLASVAAEDPELAALLRAVRTAADALERAQRINLAMVRGALSQVGELLDGIRRAQPGAAYDGRATLTAPPPAAATGWSA